LIFRLVAGADLICLIQPNAHQIQARTFDFLTAEDLQLLLSGSSNIEVDELKVSLVEGFLSSDFAPQSTSAQLTFVADHLGFMGPPIR
jgi:hypothetical protein